MSRLTDRVALVTGAARGQGRSHAIRLAEEGAKIIAVDICAQIDSVPFPMATPADLDETVGQVRAAGGEIRAYRGDVRDRKQMLDIVDDAVGSFGRLDIVAANAGIVSYAGALELSDSMWDDVIDVNLSGAWNTIKAALPHIVSGGRGGAIVITSSGAGLRGMRNMAAYVASKHGVVGLARALAVELAEYKIRVNTLHPATVNTPMIHNDASYKLFRPDLEHPTMDDAIVTLSTLTAMHVPWVEPADVTEALLYLVSDAGRYVSGVALPVDTGRP
jgi:SDR family mycofactocin-dependent oxidoreductase